MKIPTAKKSITNPTIQKQGNSYFSAFGFSVIICGNSSWLLSISYHKETETLDIKTSKNGASYTYSKVPSNYWDALVETSKENGSLGAFINKLIKPNHKLISKAI